MDAEDARLWAAFRRGVQPLARPAPRSRSSRVSALRGRPPQPDPAILDRARLKAEFRAALNDPPAPAAAPAVAATRDGEGAAQSSSRRAGASGPRLPVALDRREQRRLAAGRIAIEARLDLHGHRRHEAYEELQAFILRSRARGLRHVLVITGKGSRSPREGEDMGGGGEAGFSSPVRGVLRQQVPQWLSGPTLCNYIVGFEQAHPRHGGEGALYVRLRRR